MKGDFPFSVWSSLEEGLILIGETTHELYTALQKWGEQPSMFKCQTFSPMVGYVQMMTGYADRRAWS